VGEQLVDRDLAPGRGAGRQVVADPVRYPQPPLALQQEDGRRGELLGQRADAELRAGGVGGPVLAVGQAVAGAQHHLAVAGDEHAAAEVRGLGPHRRIERGREAQRGRIALPGEALAVGPPVEAEGGRQPGGRAVGEGRAVGVTIPHE
jgi:hypothetical protein